MHVSAVTEAGVPADCRSETQILIMLSEKKTAGNDNSPDKQHQHWLQVRRRVTGAAAVCVALAIVWHLGDVEPPPPFEPAALPAQKLTPPKAAPELQDARKRLEETRSLVPAAGSINDGVHNNDELTGTNGGSSNITSAAGVGDADIADIAGVSDEVLAESESDYLSLFREHFEGNEEEEEGADTADIAVNKESLAAPSPFVVQIGAFRERKRAVRVAKHLRQMKYIMILEKLARNGDILYRVRAVGYSSRADAELARRSIAELGYKSSQVLDTQ